MYKNAQKTEQVAGDTGHLAVLVTLLLVEHASDAFLPLIRHNAEQSLSNEPQCYRFDICVNPSVPNEVLLYELYEDRAAFDRHLESPHFQDFERQSRSYVESKSVSLYWLSR